MFSRWFFGHAIVAFRLALFRILRRELYRLTVRGNTFPITRHFRRMGGIRTYGNDSRLLLHTVHSPHSRPPVNGQSRIVRIILEAAWLLKVLKAMPVPFVEISLSRALARVYVYLTYCTMVKKRILLTTL